MTSPIGGVAFPTMSMPSMSMPSMSMPSIGAIGDVAATTEAAAGTQSATGSGFAGVLATALDQLQTTQSATNDLATQAATGDLRDVHDYMIAANEAKLATEMVVTVKNKAVEAFNEIMRMPV
ncbi:flagellar hook-basal body complex protein FliE [Geodermatophilus sabuli]|uniref:Flagellar hook-basal body complex protein FliE n=1 Tax=Geodermatophilus sabuli TaxID=1564158 RepID=A0A285EGG0_9ACTN|nr:flagellar hook-basal body complex protein FliE [Geodermatophilus sabuli]MBB3083149.1 flagellar hook-basal body complex protein FliE [Geodermatophilus sabuli]SNX98145.1 flagellar hook-basal body complex protein FliE [Geodermatophilus sabuli]